jgi:hypothetical protein
MPNTPIHFAEWHKVLAGVTGVIVKARGVYPPPS